MGDALIKSTGFLRRTQKIFSPLGSALHEATNKKFGDPIQSITTSSAKDKIDSLEAQKQGSIDRTNVARRSLLR